MQHFNQNFPFLLKVCLVIIYTTVMCWWCQYFRQPWRAVCASIQKWHLLKIWLLHLWLILLCQILCTTFKLN